MTKRIVFIALLVAAWYVLGLPGLRQTERQKHGFVLRLRLRSSAQSATQVFFDVGRGVREPDSVSQGIAGGGDFSNYDFPAPSSHVQALRFDPLTTAGQVTVQSATIANAEGHVLYTFAPTDFVPANQIKSLEQTPEGLLITTTDGATDPSVTIQFEAPLVFPGVEGIGVKTWLKIIGWHTLTGVVAFGLLVLGATLARRRWGARWLDMTLAPLEGPERIPLETWIYTASAAVAAWVSVLCLGQLLFRLLVP